MKFNLLHWQLSLDSRKPLFAILVFITGIYHLPTGQKLHFCSQSSWSVDSLSVSVTQRDTKASFWNLCLAERSPRDSSIGYSDLAVLSHICHYKPSVYVILKNKYNKNHAHQNEHWMKNKVNMVNDRQITDMTWQGHTESHLSIHDCLKARFCTRIAKRKQVRNLNTCVLCHPFSKTKKLEIFFQMVSVLWLDQSSINDPLFDLLDVHGAPSLFQNNLNNQSRNELH